MGNSNSGSFNTAQSPPPWTQSLPRDAHRQKKHGAVQQGTKVLPARIPGQRLRPTENGRILHHQGTISHRNLIESISVPNQNQVTSPTISQQHSTSMSALNLSPSMAPRSRIPEPVRDIISPNRKPFKSEPDLRDVPFSEMRHTHGPNPLHTIIHESPTKGRIMSKKRYKAPPPPQDYNPDLPIQSRLVTEDSPSAKSKLRKGRIFKKNNVAKVTRKDGEDGLTKQSDFGDERRSRNSSKKNSHTVEETKERTRSLDNLHHGMQITKEQISYPMHIVSINTPEQVMYTDYQKKSKHYNNSELEYPPRLMKKEKDLSSSGAMHRPSNAIDKKEHYKYIDDRFSHSIENGNDNYGNSPVNPNLDQRFAQNVSSIDYPTNHMKSGKKNNYNEDPWDKAEREWVEKKNNSEMLQKEITSVAKNLKKIPSMSIKVCSQDMCQPNRDNVNDIKSDVQDSKYIATEPKTFFFGMDPELNSDFAAKAADPELQIQQATITKTVINDKVTRSLDRRSKNRIKQLECEEESQTAGKKHIAKKIDEFVANIERNKLNLKPSQAELLHSISHEDGGYHSRQSSETWQTENEKEDNNKIKMNLRPTLPKRQLELPRFSPNAAWRSLGNEPLPRGKENLSDTLENHGPVQIQDEKTIQSKHLSSSRGSGEKSGDSGISGDGGSPGLVGDFEPMILKKRDVYNGPIAISSPVSSSKLESKRTWTPAQDLDDNSFEDSGDHSSKLESHEVSTFPKLTSRNNMFMNIIENKSIRNGPQESEFLQKSIEKSNGELQFSKRNILQRNTEIDYPTGNKFPENTSQSCENADLNGTTWRENWSLSRSIPNSINKCDKTEQYNDCNSNSSIIQGTRSESRVSNSDAIPVLRPITPSYMQHGDSGHIMYLPQYKPYNIKYKPHMRDCHSGNDDEAMINFAPENCKSFTVMEDQTRSARDILLEKKKKFAYKSTIRMLEKRWLEEKLTKDAKEKESRRHKEMDEIMKVEKEFRNKREKEKIKIKKQLQLMNSLPIGSSSTSNTGSVNEDHTGYDLEMKNNRNYREAKRRDVSSSSPIRDNIAHDERNVCTPEYSNSKKDQLQEPTNFVSGMKKWVKGRNKYTNGGGYTSDASTTTIASGSRQEPDGAPAITNQRGGEQFREVVIAGSRSRNGSLIIGESPHSSEIESEMRYRPRGDYSSDMHSNTSVCTSISSEQKRNHARNSFPAKPIDHSAKRYIENSSKSPAASESSRTSSRRPYSPNLRGHFSPDSKRSLASEPLVLTQELYKESRDPKKHSKSNKDSRISAKRPTSQQSIKYYKNARDNELIDNYRRTFAQGQLQNYPQRKYQEDYDRHHIRQPQDDRNPKVNRGNQRKNYSIDAVEAIPHRKSPFRQSLSYNYRVPLVNSSPARFSLNHLTPYGPPEEFRPVVFNSNGVNKALIVK